MIEVRGLKKTFDGFAALDGADLSVPRGAVYGLVGPNGAGKTTLLRHLTGVYHQDSGSVTLLVSSHNLRELEDVCDHVGVMSRGKLLLEHSLSELQDYTVKLQLAFEGTELPALPQEIKVLHHAQTGRVHTLICRGSAEELEQQLAALHPIFIDAVPLSLEEIFIYELGGEDYAIRDIVL